MLMPAFAIAVAAFAIAPGRSLSSVTWRSLTVSKLFMLSPLFASNDMSIWSSRRGWGLCVWVAAPAGHRMADHATLAAGCEPRGRALHAQGRERDHCWERSIAYTSVT